MPKIDFTFQVNCTDKNPFGRLGLRCNPFPQHGKMELDRVDRAFNSLGGEPVKSPDDIRQRLKGAVSDEVIDLVVANYYKPGELVKAAVTLRWGKDQDRYEE